MFGLRRKPPQPPVDPLPPLRRRVAEQAGNAAAWSDLADALAQAGDWCRAEVALRSAIALGLMGASRRLARVAARNGSVPVGDWVARAEGFWRERRSLFDAPVTSNDVRDAIELLCDRGDVTDGEILGLMRACGSRRELLARIMAGEEFRRYHADLLRFTAETGWGG